MIETIIYILGIIATIALILYGELKNRDELTLGQLCFSLFVSIIGSWVAFFILIVFFYSDVVVYRKNKKKKIDVSE